MKFMRSKLERFGMVVACAIATGVSGYLPLVAAIFGALALVMAVNALFGS
jgi:hypothetical protein